ncbi:MAG: serine hydrolase [Leptospiraceae bacterium]|nr:serine hydrolase [Leptospiraceae bacterium]MCP5510444.1 serine hydrolase [Leptospiraceae bacterium]
MKNKYFYFSFLIILLSLLYCKKLTVLDQGVIIPTPPDLPEFKRKYWPTDEWKSSTPEEQGMSSEALQKMEEYAFQTTGLESERKGIRTDGIVIIRNGYLVYEKYARGYSETSPHLLWSVSKSFANALIGIAVRKGILNIDDYAYKYFDIVPSETHKKIKIRHLLNMTSGLKSEEDYETGPLFSTVIAMLYTRGRDDMANFGFQLPMRAEPGTFVYYSSCDTNILMSILKTVAEEKDYGSFPWKELFDPIGMKNVSFEQDRSGTFIGSSYIYATHRDTAKFGFLYLNNGVWNGQKILPDNWVKFSRTPSEGYQTTVPYPDMETSQYTAQWYSNFAIPDKNLSPPWPDAPSDTFAALGHWGQIIFVIPSLDMVIVRTGDDREKVFSKNLFLKYIVESVTGENGVKK